MASEHFHHILTINSGSPSIKFAFYRMGRVETVVLSGSIGGISQGFGIFHVKDGDGTAVLESHLQPRDHSIVNGVRAKPSNVGGAGRVLQQQGIIND